MNSLMQMMPQWSESSGRTTEKQILERVAEMVPLLVISVKQKPIQSNITHTHTHMHTHTHTHTHTQHTHTHTHAHTHTHTYTHT